MALQVNKVEVETRAGVRLLEQVCLTVRPARLTAILGPNGAGKSTFLSTLAGLRQPSRGEVVLGDRPLHLWPIDALARCRAVMLQDTSVAFDFMRCMEVAHMANRSIRSLSGGERARAQLARALAQIWPWHPHQKTGRSNKWLLLDEPIAALDLQHQHRVLRIVRDWALEHGVGVVIVMHDINLALRYADDVCVLRHGRCVGVGAAADVLTPELLRDVWKVNALPVQSHAATAQYVFEPVAA
jgi:iron complex transport system ATP-binding protein